MPRRQRVDIQAEIESYSNLFDISTFSKPETEVERVEIRHKGLPSDAKDQIHIIRFDFDWKKDLQGLIRKCSWNNATVIAFNLPAAGWYLGRKSNKDLVDIGYRQVKRVLEQGVRPENIVLDGLCLTSAIATLVAKRLFDEGLVVNLFNDRSFADTATHITSAALERHQRVNDVKIRPLSTKVLRVIEKPSIAILRKRLVVGPSFRALYMANPDRINYIVFRPVKSGIAERALDGTIAHENSIHKCIKDFRLACKKPIKDSIELVIDLLTQGEHDFDVIIEQLRANLEKYLRINQEQIIKNKVVQLFRQAIREVETRNTEHCKAALGLLRQATFIINDNHKVQKLYTDPAYKLLDSRRVFEACYDKISATTVGGMIDASDNFKDPGSMLELLTSQLPQITPSGRHSFFQGLVVGIVQKTIEVLRQSPDMGTARENMRRCLGNYMASRKEEWFEYLRSNPKEQEDVLKSFYVRPGHVAERHLLVSRLTNEMVEPCEGPTQASMLNPLASLSPINMGVGTFNEFIKRICALNAAEDIQHRPNPVLSPDSIANLAPNPVHQSSLVTSPDAITNFSANPTFLPRVTPVAPPTHELSLDPVYPPNRQFRLSQSPYSVAICQNPLWVKLHTPPAFEYGT